MGQIRSTIGQTNLFINQRFKQFNGLIDDCEFKRGHKETKVEDLQGFWDMLCFQIIELHNKFDALNHLMANNWVQIEPKVEPKVVKQTNKKMSSKCRSINGKEDKQISVKPLIRSSIREQIQSMTKKVEEFVDKDESFGEKENLKSKSWTQSAKANNSPKKSGLNKKLHERQHESSDMRTVLKRTPLSLNAIKK